MGCNPSSCAQQREQCMAGCVDWIDRFEIPSLIDSLDLDPVLRDSLKDRLIEVVQSVGKGVNAVQLQAGKSFAAFRTEVAALAEKQELEPQMALALDQAATQAERQLRSAQLCEPSSGALLLGGREIGLDDSDGMATKSYE